ncbi:flagellar basal body L-ring protein FlgH [Agarivorans sp. TSD2052]|uniref:flagellar basal body L-ring protein FlgH n=1 Tax=Agarivorans sp. TSD2052 TaxID=2937286 RepID=UPI00200D1744|nr:flagellar basal body L-ring protein FlgH [Agarivorans sp. TSD2052]UPW20150.1 flagellar basal body L-ring protein FlgH [Agarivorans sp. TSD2052]
MYKLIVLAGCVAMAGCASVNNTVVPDDPAYAPVYPEDVAVESRITGSLFTEDRANNLYSDKKAHRVGDIIVVTLAESTQASKSASNELAKDKTLNLNQITVPGGVATIGGNPIELGLSQDSDFSGEADAAQSNSLAGNISVNVVQVLANGNLIISGEKWLMLNNGNEYIRLTGIIRPEDVAPDNSIMSLRIANARIQYGGTGDFANTTEQGWLSQFFNSQVWPF